MTDDRGRLEPAALTTLQLIRQLQALADQRMRVLLQLEEAVTRFIGEPPATPPVP